MARLTKQAHSSHKGCWCQKWVGVQVEHMQGEADIEKVRQGKQRRKHKRTSQGVGAFAC